MIRPAPLRDVLQESVASGVLDDAGAQAVVEAAARADADHTPWFLRILIGGAAWVGACFLLMTLLGILAIALSDHLNVASVLLGLGSAAAGVVLGRAGGGEFRRQAALVLVVAGQMMIVGGLGDRTGSATAASLATIVTSLLLIVAVGDPVYRFLAASAVIVAALVIAFEQRVPLALGIATVLVTLIPIATWRGGPISVRLSGTLDPIGWAGVLATCGLLLTSTLIDVVAGPPPPTASWRAILWPTPWPLTVYFAGLLVWLTNRVTQEHGNAAASPGRAVALMTIAGVAACTWTTPAVSGAAFLIALGFDRRRPGVVGVAAACLVTFLGLYYYSLSLSLMQKAGVLVASGIVCLIAAEYFRRVATVEVTP